MELMKITKNEKGEQLVSARELYGKLGMDIKNVSRWLEKNIVEDGFFNKNVDYIANVIKTTGNNKTIIDYIIKLDMAKHLCMMARTEKAKEIREYFIKCEKELMEKTPRTYIEALRETLKLAEENEILQLERDIAIKTKAEIGSRREATAMSTAGVQTKKANKLEKELDRSKEYATIKRMGMLYHGQKFDWRKLKNAAKEMASSGENTMDKLIMDVFDQNYGTLNSYHQSVWMEVYALEIK
jgi:phage anti-repressor protein